MKQNVNDSRPQRIVLVDDESSVLEIMELLVRSVFPNAILLVFSNSKEAWQELSERNPDLLLTDDLMPGLRGKEIVQRLADKKATYPIIVHSAYHSTDEEVHEFVNQGLNIKFIRMPFEQQDYRKLLESLLPPTTH